MTAPLTIQPVMSHIVLQIALSLAPTMIYIGGFMVSIAVLKNMVIKPALVWLAKEFDSDIAKEWYYDLYIYEQEDSPLARKRKRYESGREKWINSTDIFEDKKEAIIGDYMFDPFNNEEVSYINDDMRPVFDLDKNEIEEEDLDIHGTAVIDTWLGEKEVSDSD